jgi:GNAT superfamily N-acetyltransferase
MSANASVSPDLSVRPYRDLDEPEVLELLRGSLGEGPAGERTPEYFRWKHLENPFGRSYMIVAELDGQIIGFRALMRWRFRVGDRTIEAVRPVDTVTHPDHRGRGVFSMLTRTALDSLRGEVHVVFNTPNSNSLPGYLKLGWTLVGEIPVWVRISRPARFIASKLRRERSSGDTPGERPAIAAPTAGDVLADQPAISALIEGSEVAPWGFSTPRSVDHLRWRYGQAPLLGYHAVSEERGGEVIGLALFRLRSQGSLWGLSVGDVIVRPGDVATARRLLGAARRATDIAYVAMSFPPGSAAARARGATALKAPRGMAFVVNPLEEEVHPDPRLLSSWALSTGDVEVF